MGLNEEEEACDLRQREEACGVENETKQTTILRIVVHTLSAHSVDGKGIPSTTAAREHRRKVSKATLQEEIKYQHLQPTGG